MPKGKPQKSRPKAKPKGGPGGKKNPMPSCPEAREESKTISVRRISNGYLIRESSSSPKGGYKEKETFSKAPPKLDI